MIILTQPTEILLQETGSSLLTVSHAGCILPEAQGQESHESAIFRNA
ncbi:hypothetical protein HBA43_18190 [Providencia rettgeri]|nr:MULTISPECIES: hypothetical protein [Providencia]EJD6369172.1 hypothetical protein [Providencia rettgeri]EJD6373969.1 hypothetical protein [Providencia rettgeri]EJD6411348.1 hypothetical protein [Providencia rettgeri]ELR5033078.1 hypothetical protein [Providencia rettgeri]ELR5129280.1 hypothetical protein [Providencia rettgeri]